MVRPDRFRNKQELWGPTHGVMLVVASTETEQYQHFISSCLIGNYSCFHDENNFSLSHPGFIYIIKHVLKKLHTNTSTYLTK